MAKTATLLEAKDYATALGLADRSISEMVEHLGPGDGATRWFCVMLVHKALALAGLGKKNDALWYWHEVLSMYSKFSETDLTSFGEAGAFSRRTSRRLAPNPLRVTRRSRSRLRGQLEG